MIGKVIQRIKLYRSLRFFQYLYLNHFCKNIIRTDQSHIFPYKNAVLDMAPTAKIILGGGDIELGCDLDALPLEEYRRLSDLFDEDVYPAISLETCVLKRTTDGSPNPDNMSRELENYKHWLASQKQ